MTNFSALFELLVVLFLIGLSNATTSTAYIRRSATVVSFMNASKMPRSSPRISLPNHSTFRGTENSFAEVIVVVIVVAVFTKINLTTIVKQIYTKLKYNFVETPRKFIIAIINLP